jgi:hypothetical protein
MSARSSKSDAESVEVPDVEVEGQEVEELESEDDSEESAEPSKPMLTPELLDTDLGKMIFAEMTEASDVVSRNQKVIDAANAEDAKLLVQNLRAEHPLYDDYQKANELVNTLAAQMDADNADKVELPTPDEVAESEKVVEMTRESVKAHLKFLNDAYGVTYDISEIVPSNLKPRRGRKPGTGKGIKKPRLQAIDVKVGEESVLKLNAANEKATERATFSNLAAWMTKDAGLKVDVGDLQAHAYEVAKTQDLTTVNGPVEFAATVGDKHYMVSILPAPAKK